MKPRTYSEAGVDVRRGDDFASFIARMNSNAVSPSIGAFAGGVPLPLDRYRDPRMLACTDGVGTKLLVARRLGDHTTVGIDLVAMCVNDLAVCGADPVLFLDYIACGRINEAVLQEVIAGVVRGCEMAGCTLAGGETAEMPDMYGPQDIDLAGFSVGIVEADAQLPKTDSIEPGDVVIGLPSSGIHSNGLSLARKVFADAGDEVYRELITPTRIYVGELARVRPLVKAAAHVTGGGLEANLSRVVPSSLGLRLSWDWQVPAVFRTIQRHGEIQESEMRSVFNMGIGVALVVGPDSADTVQSLLGDEAVHLGEVTRG
jgi:phosphoribosylaminoimidazole synthetase